MNPLSLIPRLALLTLLAAFVAPPAAAQAQAPTSGSEANPVVAHGKGQVRELKVTLVDGKGAPVSGARVELYGTSRGSRWPAWEPEESSATSAWWTFTTAKDGTFTARFAIAPYDSEGPVPLHGRFFFVASLADGRKAVSAPVYHQTTHDEAASYRRNEWDAQEAVFTADSRELTLQLQRGRTITGVVVSTTGQPLAGHAIIATHDMHIESRTGAGGEILAVRATTDAQGRFQLEGVYPVDCTFTLEGEGYWSRTQVALKSPTASSTRWVESMPRVGGLPLDTEISLRVEVAPQVPTHRFHGLVVDAKGKPMAGVTVVAGHSRTADAESFSDTHSFESTTTNAQGQWELNLEGRWVRFLEVRRTPDGEPLHSEDFEGDNVGLASPGEYRLIVQDP